MKCPRDFARFHRSVNMSAQEIRAWAKNPQAQRFSWQSTRDRLPALARLKAKPKSTWSEQDCAYARRVVNFNTRMGGAAKKRGCTDGYAISLRNWGRRQCRILK